MTSRGLRERKNPNQISFISNIQIIINVARKSAILLYTYLLEQLMSPFFATPDIWKFWAIPGYRHTHAAAKTDFSNPPPAVSIDRHKYFWLF